jgi:hypothetical protein
MSDIEWGDDISVPRDELSFTREAGLAPPRRVRHILGGEVAQEVIETARPIAVAIGLE